MTSYDLDILARTLYGEARGEYGKVGPTAFIAIANVIMNRLKERKKRYGLTLAEVCLKPWQFSCWNENDPNRSLLQGKGLEKQPLFRVAHGVAHKVAEGLWPDLTRGSNHYHAISCRPPWAKTGKKMIHLGHHVFYKLT